MAATAGPPQDPAWWQTPAAAQDLHHSSSPGMGEDFLMQRIRALEEQALQNAERSRALVELVTRSALTNSKGQDLDELNITVTAEMKIKICEGKFVDLSSLLAKSFTERPEEGQVASFSIDEQGRLVPKVERRAKAALSIEQWSSAFLVFMSVYMKVHHDCTQGLLAYMDLIRNAARDNPGSGWSMYDQQFRSRKEAEPSRPWGMIDTQLWLQIFSRPTVLQQVPLKPKGRSATKTEQSKVCFHFNKPSGCTREGCRYEHKCAGCGGASHGILTCRKTKPPQPAGEQAGSTATHPNQSFRFGSSGSQQ